MSTKSNVKRPIGLYVWINGAPVPVTGARQSASASARIPAGMTRKIDRWTGSIWLDTGLVLHGAPASKTGEAS